MSPASYIHRFLLAQRALDAPAALIALAMTLRDEGMPQSELYSLFAGFQRSKDTDPAAYNAIIDTMDLIHGGPWAKGRDLYSQPLPHCCIESIEQNASMTPTHPKSRLKSFNGTIQAPSDCEPAENYRRLIGQTVKVIGIKNKRGACWSDSTAQLQPSACTAITFQPIACRSWKPIWNRSQHAPL